MRVVFLGFTLGQAAIDEILRLDVIMPVQTHKFAWSLVRGIAANKCEVSLISTHPVSNYPRMPRLFFRGDRFTANGVDGISLFFINLLGLKHMTRFFSCLIQGVPVLSSLKPDVLLIHGVHSPFLLFGALVRWCSSIKTVVVLTDPPGVAQPGDSGFVRFCRHIDIWFVKSMLAKANGVVVLAAPLASDFAPDLPHLLLEGIVDRNVGAAGLQAPARDARRAFKVVYAGGLLAEYGIDRLVQAVRASDKQDIELHLFGKGELAVFIAAQAACDDRIHFHGFMNQSELLAELGSADLLVNPRPTDQSFVRYSFPSKLLEYMALGVPVLTTRLPSIPEDYVRYINFIEDESAGGIGRAMEALAALPRPALLAKAELAKRFVLESRTEVSQGARLAGFFSKFIDK